MKNVSISTACELRRIFGFRRKELTSESRKINMSTFARVFSVVASTNSIVVKFPKLRASLSSHYGYVWLAVAPVVAVAEPRSGILRIANVSVWVFEARTIFSVKVGAGAYSLKFFLLFPPNSSHRSALRHRNASYADYRCGCWWLVHP